MIDTVIVSKKALKEVLEALVGDSHYIRELQATIHTPLLGDMPPNPIKTLIDEFQNQPSPVFWYRKCGDGCYEGPIHNASIENVRRNSGAWTPLFE